jgi:hypothetical protein
MCPKGESIVTTESSFAICDVNWKSFELWINPGPSDLTMIPDRIRFTADRAMQTLHVWDYSCAMHTDISMYLGLHEDQSNSDSIKDDLWPVVKINLGQFWERLAIKDG